MRLEEVFKNYLIPSIALSYWNSFVELYLTSVAKVFGKMFVAFPD